MDCDELIGEMLSCSGGTAEQQRYEITAGLASPATPDACSGGTAGQQRYEVTGQKAPDRVQKYRENFASVAAGGQAGRYGLLTHVKAFTTSHIEELDDFENREAVRPPRGETRGGDDEDTGVSSAPDLCGGWYLCFSRSRPKTNQALLLTSRATRLSGTHLAVPPASYNIVMACSKHR